MTLLISIPDIPFTSINRKNLGTYNQFGDKWNAVNGERFLYAYQESTGDMVYEFDCGAGRRHASNHIIIARADRLKTCGVSTISLDASSPSSSYVSQFTESSFNSAVLYGPQTQDYINYSFNSQQFRKWRFTAAGASNPKILSKIYFGTSFDMGIDPVYSYEKVFESLPEFETESGAMEFARLADPFYRFTFTWEGVSDTKQKEFFNKIVRQKDTQKLFLFTTANHHILNGFRVLHAKLVEASSVNSGKVRNWNDIEATFEEIIG